jgi:hypothetical protein
VSRALAIIALLATGCVHLAGPAFREPPLAEPLAFTLDQVSVRDGRGEVTKETFDTPLISSEGQRERRPIVLGDETAVELKNRLARALIGGPQRVKIEVVLRRGLAGWSATFWSETARADAEVEVVVSDAKTRAVLWSSRGKAWAQRTFLDVADDDPPALFHLAVLAALDDALASPAMKREEPAPAAL